MTLQLRFHAHRTKARSVGGLREKESFARQLEVDAAAGRVRGYVLMSDDQPAAYVFCRIDQNVIVYKHIGYAARFARQLALVPLCYI